MVQKLWHKTQARRQRVGLFHSGQNSTLLFISQKSPKLVNVLVCELQFFGTLHFLVLLLSCQLGLSPNNNLVKNLTNFDPTYKKTLSLQMTMRPAQPDWTFWLNSDCREFFLQKSYRRHLIFTLTRESRIEMWILLHISA